LEAAFDRAWRESALAGDAAAVRRLCDAAIGPLHAFCLHRVGGDRGLAEDVVQETLLRAIRDLARYDPVRSGGQVIGWLVGLARNEIRRARARGRTSVSLDALWDAVDAELIEAYARLSSEPLPDEELERAETRSLVNATMSQLPPDYRESLEAKYVEGRSVRDIAAALGRSEKAVESQLTRAREAFRATFTALARHLRAAPQP
jgi:RNA polymerase sigma-70 factor (ECF subfamily)